MIMSYGVPVLILKEGTQRTTGRDALRANIMAARVLAEILKTSLGPRGLDKMLVDSFGDVTVTNDGVTIVKEMEVNHPAAKLLVEVAKAQDAEVGDGTTTAVVLAGALLEKAEFLLDQNIHPTLIMEGYSAALSRAIEILDSIAMKVSPQDDELLRRLIRTSISSKYIGSGATLEKLTELILEAAKAVAEPIENGGGFNVRLDNVKIEKKKGESLTDSVLVKGTVLDKEVVHPGMPRRVENAKIALLDAPLEIKKPEISAKINITSPEQMRAFLEEETKLLKEMVDKIAEVGANVVICQKGIDDVAQHFLAKKGILAVRRVKKSDMEKLARATGGRIVSNIEDLQPGDLGEATLVEERKVGEDKMVFVEGAKNAKSVTILIRGGFERLIAEGERALRDSLSAVADAVKFGKIVGGGGAVEIEVAKRLRAIAPKVGGKQQLAIEAFAKALEALPSTLAENAGLDALEMIMKLRAAHSDSNGRFMGINVFNGNIEDMFNLGVIEPAAIKLNAVKAATEAATMILRIDDFIAASKVGAGKEGAPGKKEGEKEGEEKED
jgi:thermosome